MMQFDRMTLGKKARELGFVRDTFEKVCRLADVLDFIQKDELLSNALALKGGTAINLTIFNLPRLSVDIDMDFSENVPREEMLAIRKQITERISKYMTAAGYHLSQKSKTYHALDSFVYEYQNTGGMKDNLKIEINYMLRCHVLAPVRRTVNLPWLEQELTVLSVDPLEIYGSKIVALLNRAAPRDLYDIHTMMEYGLFDESQEPMLKKCVMFYSAIGSDSVPDRFHFEQIASVSQQRVKTDLIPVLRRGTWFDAQQAHEQVIAYLEKLLIPDERELSFWTSFGQQEYRPELLFQDADILARIGQHPWHSGNAAIGRISPQQERTEASMKKHGHYCKICGEYKANEKFSGKGHAAHICKACSTLPPEKKAEMLAINRLLNLPWQLSKEQKDWLRRRTHDRRTEVKALAQQQYEVRFGYTHTCDELDDAEEIE